MVCHGSGGKKKKYKTLCISAEDVADHLAHGDLLGECGVDASCDDGLQFRSFSAEESHVIETNIADYLTISVYPNPAASNVTVELSTTEEVNGKIMIVNSMGQTIKSQFVGSVSDEGTTRVNLNLEGLERGIYFIQFEGTNGQNVTQTLMVTK